VLKTQICVTRPAKL